MNPVDVKHGDGPMILGQPHGGTYLPEEILWRMNDIGLALSDTDWHVTRLYSVMAGRATVVKANFHRYVIDANRAPDDASLYPGMNTTGLVPLTNFDGLPIWREGFEPDLADVSRRIGTWHRPYHDALKTEIERVKSIHGFAILLDCHTIRSQIPFLFDGKLPDFNIGTNGGVTCHPAIEKVAVEVCADSPFSSVLNGRFKGGWTTRHYGHPFDNVHAIQMEIAQCRYMDEFAPWTWRENIVGPTSSVLAKLGHYLHALAPQLSRGKT
jgi:N-formylglutamate deformylase